MLLFRGSAVYFFYNFLQEADGTDCSNGELESFLATGYPVSRGWAVQSSLDSMNKQKFYVAMLAYDRAMARQGYWQLLVLCLVLATPIALLLAIPMESRTPLIRYSVIAAMFAILVGAVYFGQYRRKQTAKRLGMFCPECDIVFDHLSLRNLGFTNVCGKCGAKVFVESNTLSEPTP